MNNERTLTSGNIGRLMLRFSLPVLLASIIHTAYSSVDMLFLGNFASPGALAGAGNSSTLIFTITGIFIGLMNGGTILIGQYYGAKQDKDAARATGSIAILLVCAAVFSASVLLIFGRTFLRLIEIPAEAEQEAWDYMFVCAFGLLFTMGYSAVSSVLRALGNSKAPLVFITISCIINITMDYVFVGILQMGAGGAALATVIAQIISFTLALLYLIRRGLPYRMSLNDLRPDFRTILRIIKLGVPISLQTVLNMISFVIIAAVVNKMGVFASAANGIVNNIVNFYMIIPMSLSTALSAISAQNLGAGKPERALRAAKLGIMFSLMIAIPATVFASIFPEPIVSLITKDPDVIRESSLFLISFSWDCVFVGFVFCINGFFNGCGITKFVAIHEMIAAFAVRIPLSWALSLIPGATLFHVGIGTPAATAASLLMCLVYYRLKLSHGRLAQLKIAG